jgi:hypothetical protein
MAMNAYRLRKSVLNAEDDGQSRPATCKMISECRRGDGEVCDKNGTRMGMKEEGDGRNVKGERGVVAETSDNSAIGQ